MHRTFSNSGHYIQLHDPGAVVDAVSQVVTAVRDGASLP
jgi:hypothetical protein